MVPMLFLVGDYGDGGDADDGEGVDDVDAADDDEYDDDATEVISGCGSHAATHLHFPSPILQILPCGKRCAQKTIARRAGHLDQTSF
eukprot:7803577-Pyramimonas_sp.AAC.1